MPSEGLTVSLRCAAWSAIIPPPTSGRLSQTCLPRGSDLRLVHLMVRESVPLCDVCVYMHVCVYVGMCMCVCMCVYVCMYACVCMCVYVCVYGVCVCI